MSVNTQIADALVEQQLRDARVETQLRREAWAILALLEADILAAFKVSDPTQYALLARRRREVEALMAEEIEPLIVSRYAQLAAMLDDAMMRLATHEAAVVQQVVNDVTQEETIADLPSERRLRAGVVHGLFPSATKPTDLATTGRTGGNDKARFVATDWGFTHGSVSPGGAVGATYAAREGDA